MISDIVSVLGFLGRISDKADRELKEKDLFSATKNIIINFIETSIKLLADASNNKQYVIAVKIPAANGYSLVLITEDKIDTVWDHTKIVIFAKYKLTLKQQQYIIDMIINMSTTVYEKNYFNTKRSNVYLYEKSNNPINYKQIKEIDKEYYIPIVGIEKRLEELKNGDWDSYIMTSILELG